MKGELLMVEKIPADASPEKRLFISLITRDISLIDAFLEIMDNSINAALEPFAANLKTADDYQRLLSEGKVTPKVQIDVTVSPKKIVVIDNAPGISSKMAADHVFKFGRGDAEADSSDRLSVYGIGLKRAMFKSGNKIEIISDHRQGGFELKLNVREWARVQKEPWTFEITPRPPEKSHFGTRITITDLHEEVRRRIDDGLFLDQLRERISRTYSFFIGRIVDITVNNVPTPKESFDIGENFGNAKFESGKVSCNITAGIASTANEKYRDRNGGWFVFCNGRAILFADKSTLTGWGVAGLPIFQPKHRPFLGIVFFVSTDPELLPWTTTKASVDVENAVWQLAKRHMVTVGRVITGYLDKRYKRDGTEVSPEELQDISGEKVSVLSAAVAEPREFRIPTKSHLKTTTIQYKAKTEDVKKIESYLHKPNMGGSEVGRYTFNYFLKNEVREVE